MLNNCTQTLLLMWIMRCCSSIGKDSRSQEKDETFIFEFFLSMSSGFVRGANQLGSEQGVLHCTYTLLGKHGFEQLGLIL